MEIKTKDYNKDMISLQSTNARLALTKQRIRQARLNFAKLEEDYANLQSERDLLRDRTKEATMLACKDNVQKKALLEQKLLSQKQDNSTIERHLRHIVASAGLDERKAKALLSNLEEFVEDNEKEVEKLELAIAHAKKKYDEDLKSKQNELRLLGFTDVEILSLDVRNDV